MRRVATVRRVATKLAGRGRAQLVPFSVVGRQPKAKDWDGSNVLGPWILTADEADLSTMELAVRVNGETLGGCRVSEMHFSFGELIAYASQSQKVRPGEVFGSGTATGGAGIEVGRFLSAGDVIELEGTGVGVLRTTIGSRPKEYQHAIQSHREVDGQRGQRAAS